MCPPLKKGKIEENDVDRDTEWWYLDISSDNRITGSSSTSDFQVLVKQTKNNAMAARLQYVHLPAMYNIDTGYNQISFNDSGGTITATITPGAYSMVSGTTTLPAAIASALNTASAASAAHTYTCTYNMNTYKLTITDTTANSTFYWTTYPKLSSMLGFVSDSATTNSFVSENIADISIDDLYLRIDEFGTSGRFDTTNTQYWTYRLPLNEDSFGNKQDLYEEDQLGNQTVVWKNGIRTINELHIKLVDKYGVVKDLHGGILKFGIKLLAGHG